MRRSGDTIRIFALAALAACAHPRDFYLPAEWLQSGRVQAGAHLDEVRRCEAAGAPFFVQLVVDRAFELDDQISTWHACVYGDFMSAAQEPPLVHAEPGRDTLRFTWLRTYHRPVFVRIDGDLLTAKELDGAGGIWPGHLAKTVQRRLEPGERQRLAALSERARVWLGAESHTSGRVPVLPAVTIHGAEWVLEGVREGQYGIVKRTSPKEGPMRDAGLAFLRASGFDVEPIY